MTSLYHQHADALAERDALDARAPDYRYDMDADIRWDLVNEPGVIAPPNLMELMGVDVEGLRAAGAWELFEWLYALMVCQEFIELERAVVSWVHKNEELTPSESLQWLRDEEVKHIATFQRLKKHLFAQRPELAEAARALTHEFHPATPKEVRAPDAMGHHHEIWLHFLAFEEYTIFFYEALMASGAEIQPTWHDVHRCHAQEEVCHVATDAYYGRQLMLSHEERMERSRKPVAWIMNRFTQTSRAPVRALLRLRPDLQGKVSPGKPPAGLLQALFEHPAFKETRACGPYFQWLADRRGPAS